MHFRRDEEQAFKADSDAPFQGDPSAGASDIGSILSAAAEAQQHARGPSESPLPSRTHAEDVVANDDRRRASSPWHTPNGSLPPGAEAAAPATSDQNQNFPWLPGDTFLTVDDLHRNFFSGQDSEGTQVAFPSLQESRDAFLQGEGQSLAFPTADQSPHEHVPLAYHTRPATGAPPMSPYRQLQGNQPPSSLIGPPLRGPDRTRRTAASVHPPASLDTRPLLAHPLPTAGHQLQREYERQRPSFLDAYPSHAPALPSIEQQALRLLSNPSMLQGGVLQSLLQSFSSPNLTAELEQYQPMDTAESTSSPALSVSADAALASLMRPPPVRGLPADPLSWQAQAAATAAAAATLSQRQVAADAPPPEHGRRQAEIREEHGAFRRPLSLVMPRPSAERSLTSPSSWSTGESPQSHGSGSTRSPDGGGSNRWGGGFPQAPAAGAPSRLLRELQLGESSSSQEDMRSFLCHQVADPSPSPPARILPWSASYPAAAACRRREDQQSMRAPAAFAREDERGHLSHSRQPAAAAGLQGRLPPQTSERCGGSGGSGAGEAPDWQQLARGESRSLGSDPMETFQVERGGGGGDGPGERGRGEDAWRSQARPERGAGRGHRRRASAPSGASGNSEEQPARRRGRIPQSALQNRRRIRYPADGPHPTDKYHWKKYGSKIVKFNVNKRRYEGCKVKGCPAKKTTELIEATNQIVVTYKYLHSHPASAGVAAAPPLQRRRYHLGAGPLGDVINLPDEQVELLRGDLEEDFAARQDLQAGAESAVEMEVGGEDGGQGGGAGGLEGLSLRLPQVDRPEAAPAVQSLDEVHASDPSSRHAPEAGLPAASSPVHDWSVGWTRSDRARALPRGQGRDGRRGVAMGERMGGLADANFNLQEQARQQQQLQQEMQEQRVAADNGSELEQMEVPAARGQHHGQRRLRGQQGQRGQRPQRGGTRESSLLPPPSQLGQPAPGLDTSASGGEGAPGQGDGPRLVGLESLLFPSSLWRFPGVRLTQQQAQEDVGERALQLHNAAGGLGAYIPPVEGHTGGAQEHTDGDNRMGGEGLLEDLVRSAYNSTSSDPPPLKTPPSSPPCLD